MPYKDSAVQRRYQREWAAERRAAYLEGRVCVDCGSTERLEIDHVRGEKVGHSIWSWEASRLLVELDKCETRCHDCHVERHAAPLRRHGVKRYRKGCRCDVCKAAKRAADARYREKRRRRELNSDTRFCRPVRNHSATSPSDTEASR